MTVRRRGVKTRQRATRAVPQPPAPALSASFHTWWPDDLARDLELFGELVRPTLDLLHATFRAGRLPPSLLLVGPPGMGREPVALEVAAMLTCPARGSRDCRCHSCDRAWRGVHPDVERLGVDPRRGGIDPLQARRSLAGVRSRPFSAPRRVWILDGVDAGFPGWCTTLTFRDHLEEPPPYAYFLLLAANPDRVEPTVRSRCVEIRLPGPVAVARRLGHGAIPPELFGPGDAQSLDALMGRARAVLEAGPKGPLRPLLHLARTLGRETHCFEIAAAVAVELAAGARDDDTAEGLLLLAAEVLRLEPFSRWFDRPRQLLSSLLLWRRGELGLR